MSRSSLSVAALAALFPLHAFGFGEVSLTRPAAREIPKPTTGALDEGGGTAQPERRMLLRVDEPLSLAANRVWVRVQDQVAVVRVHHVLQSNVERILQARYSMPLGAGAHMTGYAIWEQHEKLVGELMDVRRAEQLYTAVTAQELTARPEVAQEVRRVEVARDPGILRQMAPDTFETHVYPILPWSLKQVEFLYSEALETEAGWTRWRFPLSAAQAFRNPVGDLLFEIALGDSAGIGAVECDFPGARIERRDGQVVVTIAGQAVAPSQDVVVRWQTQLEPWTAAVLAHRAAGDDVGYALVRVGLPGGETQADLPLDLVVLADTSRSLHGGKAGRQEAALTALVGALRPGDTFGVVGFSGEATTLLARQAWDAHAADRLLTALGAAERGTSTHLRAGLAAGLAALGPATPGRARLLVLATDAVTHEDPADVLALSPAGVQLLALGTGHDDDVELLGRLVARHGGTAWIPGAGEWSVLYARRDPGLLQGPYGQVGVASADEAAPGQATLDGDARSPAALLPGFRRPRITAALEDSSGVIESIYPVTPTSAWAAGGAATYLLRYREPGATPVAFTAWVGDEQVERTLTLDLPAREDHHRFVASFWGRARVSDLLRREPVGPLDPHRDEIVSLSLDHRFVTPYTAFLSLPDAERERMLLGPMPPDDAEELYTFASSAGGAPEAEVWILLLAGLALALYLTRGRQAGPRLQVAL